MIDSNGQIRGQLTCGGARGNLVPQKGCWPNGVVLKPDKLDIPVVRPARSADAEVASRKKVGKK